MRGGARVILLIAPAAIHRMTFQGTDSERFHGLGSFIVSLALVPLILGMSMDAYVAGSFPRCLRNQCPRLRDTRLRAQHGPHR
jgi:hypothetical protein